MENCPICGGMGFVTKNVPLDHPDFGKAFPCVCQHEAIEARKKAHLYAISNLAVLADKTFDTFLSERSDLREGQLTSLQNAYDLAREYAIEPQGWLVFEGGFGSGKTHLAAAIANYRLSQGEDVLFITAPDLLDHLRSTYGPSSEVNYDDLFDRVRNVSLLVLDDLGAESSTAWALEKLYQLINHRYTHRLCTIFTTNKALDDIDPRVRSRLKDWSLSNNVIVDVPDFRRGDTNTEKSILFNPSLYSKVFETFDLRQHRLPSKEARNLRNAYETSLAYAKSPRGWLFFTGVHGCGKTHLAAAIANSREKLGERVIFMTSPDLFDYLRAAFNADTAVPLDRRFNDIQTAQLLVIDQLDTSSMSTWALEKLRQITNHRYESRLPTVFTTTQELEDLDPMLKSRLMDREFCNVFAILAPDYNLGEQNVSRRRQKGS
jgi:DNA replication protein DnaC